MKAYGIEAAALYARGKDNIPPAFNAGSHLIYSSPATLAFNSPGAEGYGVKRAGLSIPGSVMLLVSPGCCGRNTTLLKEKKEYENRFFFYLMDETDIVTGRHLRRIPQAVWEVCESLEKKPSVVMICITCVDALLGTDMERVCARAAERVGLPVLPCYMYALTREGRKPPMVHVRQSLYSLLERDRVSPSAVNLLGYFAPLAEECELYEYLRLAGIRKINEIGRCRDFLEYRQMGRANFNLVLNPEAEFAAADLQKRLGMPWISLTRLHRIDKIHKQYRLFAGAVGIQIRDEKACGEAEEAMEAFKKSHPQAVFAVGEGCNANPYELAAALLFYGIRVREIFGNITAADYVYLRQIAQWSPHTVIRSNLDPSMLFYQPDPQVNFVVGKDAGYYYPETAGVEWNRDIQPFGYQGVRDFFRACDRALSNRR